MTELEKRAEELSEIAKKALPVPEELTFAETYFYLCLRRIYSDYRNKTITAEQAKADKQKLVTEFGQVRLQEQVYQEHTRRALEISKLLSEADHNGCEICKRISKIYDGRTRA